MRLVETFRRYGWFVAGKSFVYKALQRAMAVSYTHLTLPTICSV